MSAPKLVLHPNIDSRIPPGDMIVQTLRDIGLIGSAFTLDDQTHFYTGPGFLDGVSFLGCAPSIQLDAPALPADQQADARAGRFCHIQLHAPTDSPRLRYKTRHNPRCRQCRTEIPAALLQTWAELGTNGVCPDCGASLVPTDLNWRQSGGCARLFLDIWGIHTAEAVPSDRLLDHLAQASDGPWHFFYIED